MNLTIIYSIIKSTKDTEERQRMAVEKKTLRYQASNLTIAFRVDQLSK